MNRNYRLIWSAAHNMIVAVAETARSKIRKCTGVRTARWAGRIIFADHGLQLHKLGDMRTLPVFVRSANRTGLLRKRMECHRRCRNIFNFISILDQQRQCIHLTPSGSGGNVQDYCDYKYGQWCRGVTLPWG